MLALEAHMPRHRALRDLEALKRSGLRLPAEALYDLVLAATESVEAAEEAMKEQIKADLRAGRTPE